MFEGFATRSITANGVAIHARVGGDGPPLLLLHGYPQTHLIWHRVAPSLARRYTVIASDLRGYGQSEKPPGGADHAAYSKRQMARDQVEMMRQLGFAQFAVCGHDRGARVAHRMCVDHPDAIRKAMLLDIAPTLAMYENTSMEFARAYWWWFWLIQPAPFPEQMVAASPEVFLRRKIGWGSAGLAPFTDHTYAAYLACVSDPPTMHAMCEDYRAAASVDLEHDRADRASGRKVACPLTVLWGAHGVIGRCFDPLAEWRKVAGTVGGHALPCGHYIPEEVPELLIAEIEAFFA
ncbi:MAG TPA: alpha/beta hydrolase [Usitatibacteraceae bacterium]|nr:alpha/beta hydrolase [Usitatibacteraceae bacterium]